MRPLCLIDSLLLVACVACYQAPPNSLTGATHDDPGSLNLSPNAIAPSNGATVPPGPMALIYGVAEQQCLSSVGSTGSTALQLLDCDCSAGQKWTFQRGHMQSYSGQCLSLTNGNLVDGNAAVLADCDSTYTLQQQLWSYHNGELLLDSTAKCLLPTLGSPGVALWTCGPEAANNDQMWVLGNSRGDGIFGVAWTPTGTGAPCMTANVTTGVVSLADCTSASEQAWILAGTQVVSIGTGACLSASTQTVTLAHCADTISQQWDVSGGQFKLQGTATCAGVDALSAGSPLHLVSCGVGQSTLLWALGL